MEKPLSTGLRDKLFFYAYDGSTAQLCVLHILMHVPAVLRWADGVSWLSTSPSCVQKYTVEEVASTCLGGLFRGLVVSAGAVDVGWMLLWGLHFVSRRGGRVCHLRHSAFKACPSSDREAR